MPVIRPLTSRCTIGRCSTSSSFASMNRNRTGVRSQELQAFRILLLQCLRDREAVHQCGPAARGLVHQTDAAAESRAPARGTGYRCALRGERGDRRDHSSRAVNRPRTGARSWSPAHGRNDVPPRECTRVRYDRLRMMTKPWVRNDSTDLRRTRRCPGRAPSTLTASRGRSAPPGDLPRQPVLEVELIGEPAQLILAGVPVAEGEATPDSRRCASTWTRDEIVRQPVRVEKTLLGVRIEMSGILATLAKPQRRQLDLALSPAWTSILGGAVSSLKRTPFITRLFPGSAPAARCSLAPASRRARRRRRRCSSTSSRCDSQISRASTSRFESAM